MSDEKKFKEGNVVRLKSGGPKMTVTQHDDPKAIYCMWFVKEEAKIDWFPEESLELAEGGDTEEGE